MVKFQLELKQQDDERAASARKSTEKSHSTRENVKKTLFFDSESQITGALNSTGEESLSSITTDESSQGSNNVRVPIESEDSNSRISPLKTNFANALQGIQITIFNILLSS